MRKQIAAGNWKMNTSFDEAKVLATELAGSEINEKAEMILIPPFPYLPAISEIIDGKDNLKLGAQNCSNQDSGAFTGDVSVAMLKSVGVQYVVIGHSERREYHNESSELLAEKMSKVLEAGLTPIFCCGEALETREAGNHESFVAEQIEKGLFHLSADQVKNVVIAYEPIWAIGTGVTASSDQAQAMHLAIRLMLTDQYGVDVADGIPILYGGSVKPDNAEELFSKLDVDGGLVGGASLKADGFASIANAFK